MRHKTTRCCLLLLVLMSLVRPMQAMAQRHIALIIGNAAYQEAPLRNPVNDAHDMAQALRDLGFEVIDRYNTTKPQMIEAVSAFGARLPQAHVGLFYYAGHGVQYHSQNYLIPVQATVAAPADLEQETLDVRRVLGRMEDSKTALNIVILDACRNNPFRNLLGFRSYGGRGLAPLPRGRSTLIAYATAPDNVAADGTGRNGTYTKHLLRYLKHPGLSLADFFTEVNRAVFQETQGTQEPWVNFSALPRFCFAGCEPPLVSVPPQRPQEHKQPTPDTPATPPFAQAGDIRQVTLATNDIIYDPFTQKIYASVPGSAGPSGNTITSIDPKTGTIGPSVFIGSEPGKLAISDNGQFLYVALDGAAAVRRFDISSQTPGLQFALGNDPSGTYYVEDIEVLPGNPRVVAVSRKKKGSSPRHAGVAIYDDGVQRPTATPDHTGSNVIEFANAASKLYGANNEATGLGFRRMSVDTSGVSVIDVKPNMISGGSGVDIKFDNGNGLIYVTTGEVIDPEARTLVGTFPGISVGALVKPESTLNRVFFLTESKSKLTRKLLAFDPPTLLLAGSLDIPGVSGTASSLIRWGADGLAFRTSSNQVFLISRVLLFDATASAHAQGSQWEMLNKEAMSLYQSKGAEVLTQVKTPKPDPTPPANTATAKPSVLSPSPKPAAPRSAIKITATAKPSVLSPWPPNNKMVPVVISGTITDKLSRVDLTGARFSVADEYGLIQPSGSITVDVSGNYVLTISLEASCRENDLDGRHYTITVQAKDIAGNTGTTSLTITAPSSSHFGGLREKKAPKNLKNTPWTK